MFEETRIRGAVFGAVVGNALRASEVIPSPASGPTSGPIHARPPGEMGSENPVVEVGAWGHGGAQLLALLDTVSTYGRFRVDTFAQRMLNWYLDGRFAPDGQVPQEVSFETAFALKRILRGAPVLQAGLVGERYTSNDALVRSLPAALIAGSDGDAFRIARQQGSVTHRHCLSKLACGLHVLVARRLLAGEGFQKAYKGALAALPQFLTKREGYKLCEVVQYRQRGQGTNFVIDSLWTALDCIETTSSFECAIRQALARGGKSAAIVSLVGGLAGAIYGVEGIPGTWLANLRDSHLIRSQLDEVVRRTRIGTREARARPTSIAAAARHEHDKLMRKIREASGQVHYVENARGAATMQIELGPARAICVLDGYSPDWE